MSIVGRVEREVYRTSQWSRITARPPITDLSGGTTSVDSLTGLTADLVVEYAVDFQFDPFSSVVLGSMADSESSDCISCPVPVTSRIGSRAVLSGLHGAMVR